MFFNFYHREIETVKSLNGKRLKGLLMPQPSGYGNVFNNRILAADKFVASKTGNIANFGTTEGKQ
jgi:hypothetical protein